MSRISSLRNQISEAFQVSVVDPIISEAFRPTNFGQDLALPTPLGTTIQSISLFKEDESTEAVVYVPDGKIDLAIVGNVGLNHDPTQQAQPFIDAAREVGGIAVVISSSRNMAGGPQTDGYARFGATEADDLMDVEHWVRRAITPNIALGGFSHGGAVAAARLERHSAIPVKGMLLGAPALDIGAAIRENAPRELRKKDNPQAVELVLDHLAFIADPIIKGVAHLGVREVFNQLDIPQGSLNYPRKLKGFQLPPTLIMHSPTDEWIPYGVSNKLAKQHPREVELVAMEGHTHDEQWNVNNPAYAGAMADFIYRRVLPR